MDPATGPAGTLSGPLSNDITAGRTAPGGHSACWALGRRHGCPPRLGPDVPVAERQRFPQRKFQHLLARGVNGGEPVDTVPAGRGGW